MTHSVKLHFNHSGGYYQEATPVPIPNTVVKLFGVDNTCLVTGREDRSLPDIMEASSSLLEAFFFLFFRCKTEDMV